MGKNFFFLSPFKDVKSLALNGSSQYVNYGATAFRIERTDTVTISFWVKMNGYSGFQTPMACEEGAGGNFRGYALYFNGSNNFNFELINASGNTCAVKVNSVPSSGAWHHIAITKATGSTPSDIKIYYDGVSQTVVTVTNTLSSGVTTSTQNFNLGRDANGGAFVDGRVNEFTFWSVAMTAGQVTELYNAGKPSYVKGHSASANLVSWSRMGDLTDSSTTVFDRVGAFDGTLVGSPSYSTDIP